MQINIILSHSCNKIGIKALLGQTRTDCLAKRSDGAPSGLHRLFSNDFPSLPTLSLKIIVKPSFAPAGRGLICCNTTVSAFTPRT